MTTDNAVTVEPASSVKGRVRLPGDKSISHRYALLSAIASGPSTIEAFAPGADCAATVACLHALGVLAACEHDEDQLTLRILGRGLAGLHPPERSLDARNSGTTLRLLAGILAAHRFRSVLTGDESLRLRPMQRVIRPLEQMGARIESAAGRPPLVISGGTLAGIAFQPPVPSAQVKSAVLLAGLHAEGETRVTEDIPTRNHTELALQAFGADVEIDSGRITVRGGHALRGFAARVPGDLSSGAFWAVAAAALPGSEIELVDVGLNPTRTAFLDVLRRFGAEVEVTVSDTSAGEPRGSVRVCHGSLGTLTLGAADVPGLIDELPALAALATHGGAIHVRGAGELRVKESDRIAALVAGLRALGAETEEYEDGFDIAGRVPLTGGVADAAGDHRLAMAFAIAALGAQRASIISGADVVDVSYPGFYRTLESIRA